MEERDIKSKFDDLISSYIEIKPVLWDLYKRNGYHHPDAVLNEIRALNDHIARCYRDDVSVEDAYDELSKAEGHLTRLIYDCFKQLNIIFFDYMERYEKLNFGLHWLRCEGGAFWEKYITNRKDIVKHIEDAKKYESVDTNQSFNCYQNAYAMQGEVYNLLNNYVKQLKLNWLKRLLQRISPFWRWFLLMAVLTIIPSCIWETYINWGKITCFLSMLLSRIHS